MSNRYNKCRRYKVQRYLETQDTSPLVFYKIGDSAHPEIPSELTRENVDRLVLSLYCLTETHRSARLDGMVETRADAWRSSLDIWRHARFYVENIDIFKIMESIYRLYANGLLRGHYCPTVKRSVFYRHWSPWSTLSLYRNFLTKEYGIRLFSWKGISE